MKYLNKFFVVIVALTFSVNAFAFGGISKPQLDARVSYVDAKEFTSLTLAKNHAVANVKTLVISKNYNITSSTDLSSLAELKIIPGGSFTVSADITLTLPPNFSAPKSYIFKGAGNVSGLLLAYPEYFGAVGDGSDETTIISKAINSAPEIYLPKNYRVIQALMANDIKISGPGKLYTTTVNNHIISTSAAQNNVKIFDSKFGSMPPGSTDDFAAVQFERGSNSTIAFSNFSSVNTGARFAYNVGGSAKDSLIFGSNIHGSQKMGVENINSLYGRIIGNTIENGGNRIGIHGVRISGATKGVIVGLNNIRDKENLISYQTGAENSISVGNYGENLFNGFVDTSAASFEGRHIISSSIIKDAADHAFYLRYGEGYRVDGMVDGAVLSGITTDLPAHDGKHRIDMTIRNADTGANIRNGKNLGNFIIDGSRGVSASISGSDNLLNLIVTNTAVSNTVYVTGNNNVITLSETGSAVTALRVDGTGNIIIGRMTGYISVIGSNNTFIGSGPLITINAGADYTKVVGRFTTITNNGAGTDLSGVYGINLTTTAIPTKGVFIKGGKIQNTSGAIGQPTGWIVSTAGGASSTTRADTTAYTKNTWATWSTGVTVWECTTAGTTAGTPPSIAGKVVGDTVTDGTVVWTLRSTVAAVFTPLTNL